MTIEMASYRYTANERQPRVMRTDPNDGKDGRTQGGVTASLRAYKGVDIRGNDGVLFA